MTSPPIPARDVARLATAGGAGLVLFVVLVAVLHVVDPERDPIAVTISEYVLGPHGWLLPFAGLGLGLGALAVAAAAAALLPAPRPRTGLGALALAGLSMLVVAAFPTDPIDPTDPVFVTTAGAVHAVAGILAFTCFAVAGPLLTRPVAAVAGRPRLGRLGFLPPLGYLLFWTTAILDAQLGGLFGERSATGMGERLMAAVFVGWLIALAAAVRRAACPAPRAVGMTRTRLLLLAGLGPALFVVVLLLDSATRPGYDPLHHFGSELANGDRGWLMIANFVVAGTLTICFAVGLRRVLRSGRSAVAAPVLVGLFGLGLVLAGVFVADPKPGYPPGSTGTAEPTLQSLVHDGNLFPTWIVMTAAMLAIAARSAADRERAWMWYSIVTAVVAMGTLLVAAGLYDADTQTGSYHGLWQRISIAVGFGYFGVLAVRLLGRRRPQTRVSSTNTSASHTA
ncbi:DUF998 domain-containing protein [Pseudonocardia humida]|uniref:DUF998 domain-containing protein n=1 Tax=Pseudonocardia humida TaxID=2800819 RepID=A0ABT0ZZ21_9PSEU|nr:DUF998 domain-containing protein [Pseudonocardia humida]MCO1655988.1 DUF998 domain-containing protein [Pseudonocardia humida]